MIIGGLFEVLLLVWAKRMKQKESNLLIGCWVLLCLSISMLLLYKTTQELPIGTAYAVWTGIELWDCFSGYRCI
jgi:quaternary ammonium compound-resistance protein SugE